MISECPLCYNLLQTFEINKNILRCTRVFLSHFFYDSLNNEAVCHLEGWRLIIRYKNDIIWAARAHRVSSTFIDLDVSKNDIKDLINKVELLSTFS